VTTLARFSTPGRLPEPTEESADAWSAVVAKIFAPYLEDLPQFFDPTVEDTPEDATVAPVAWSAFPATVRNRSTSEEQRWAEADSDRSLQDEYCEWSVARNAEGKLTRVTFTTEVPEFWEHVAEDDSDKLLSVYRELVNPEVALDDLFDDSGRYFRTNRWNATTDGGVAHLIQDSNTLGAAVDLSARATVLRERDGRPVVNQQELVSCGGLGNPFRNSDPQIAAAINNVAASGAEITLQDPLGLYIDGFLTGGMATPDGEDPALYWTVERGDPDHVLRARYEVPEERGYVVGDITAAGRPLRFGGQLADRVEVRVTALAKAASHRPDRQPCEP